MDARRAHAADRADRACQLAFQRAQLVYVENEIGGAETVGFVEDLVAHRALGRQALLGQRHAQGVDLVAGHIDFAAVLAAQLELRAALRQVIHDLAGISRFQAGIEQLHAGRGQTAGQEEQEGDEGDRNAAEDGKAHGTKISEELQNRVHG